MNRKRTEPLPLRIHMDDKKASEQIANKLYEFIKHFRFNEIVVICIGTDRSTGDSLGPLIGSKLSERSLTMMHIYGTLEQPVHALNLEETLIEVRKTFYKPLVIGIDACLGKLEHIGQITVAPGPVKPGTAVKKELPHVGDFHLTGIVNIGGMMEYFVLQNTRLFTVMSLATVIATAIVKVDRKLFIEKNHRKTMLDAISSPTSFFKKRKEELQQNKI